MNEKVTVIQTFRLIWTCLGCQYENASKTFDPDEPMRPYTSHVICKNCGRKFEVGEVVK